MFIFPGLRRKFLSGLAFFGIIAFAIFKPLSAGAGPIIFPPNGALLTDSALEVTGFRDGSGTPLFYGGEGKREEATIPGGIFAVEIELVPGKNTLTIEDEWIEVYFAGEGAARPPGTFRPPDRHAVDNSCDDCHSEPGSGVLLDEGAALCENCHDDVTAREGEEKFAVQHPPAEDGECTSCHVFHGSAISGLETADLSALCYECHDDFAEEEGVELHPAVEDDGCLGCHRPHGSSHGSLLAAGGSETCFECHDDPVLDEEGEEWATLHAAVDDGCTTCHSPHASKHGSLLLSETAELCGECHDDKNADGEGNPWETLHPPVDDGECTSCHRPHGSALSALLTVETPDLCSECHDDKNVDGDGNAWAAPHPPVEDGECTSCHAVHGSSVRAMLTVATPGLCHECHDDKRLNEAEDPWPYPHPPVQRGACLSCHGTHGGPQAGLLKTDALRLCSSCHDEPHVNHLVYEEGSGSAQIPEDFPTRDGSFVCTGCHLPHGSDDNSLWKGSQATFCTICHRY